MHCVFYFVTKHCYSVLFGATFAHQLELPVPGPLFLVAAGALAAAGKMGLVVALVLAVTACVLNDWPWYEAGRRRQGDRVLHFIHRLTRDPDAQDEKAKATFARHGPPLLVIADFVPALDAVTPPLAGMSRITRLRFLVFDGLGAGLYSCAYIVLGYVFSNDLDRAAAYAGRAGTVFAGLLVVALLILGGRHLLRRYRLTYEFGSRCRHDLIGLNLEPPSPLHPGSLKASNMSTGPVAQGDTVRHAATH
jgi:membrane protein DedA with SNARE-associated domain